MYKTFLDFMEMVGRHRVDHPNANRLDGATTRGNPRPFGWFWHNEQTWLSTWILTMNRSLSPTMTPWLVMTRSSRSALTGGRLHLVFTSTLQAQQQT